jgi:hypothetical protein
MITNKGNQIITKYLLGQSPEYAAYVSVGVGAIPLDTSETDTSSPTKESMDFEAFRVPVVSRGLVSDNIVIDIDSWAQAAGLVTVQVSGPHGMKLGDSATLDFNLSGSANAIREGVYIVENTTSNTITYSQTFVSASATPASWSASSSISDTATVAYDRERIIFKAQLPSDQRYQMTEIALYPAANNSLALNYDSKILAGFLTTEGWTYHNVSASLVESDNAIALLTNTIADTFGNVSSATFLDPVTGSAAHALFVNSNNEAFTFYERKNRYENTRLYNRCLVVPGNMTTFSSDSMTIAGAQKYIFTTSLRLNASKNSPDDYIKFALSVISMEIDAVGPPTKTRLRFDFLDSVSGQVATATELLSSGDLTASRYVIVSKQIKDFDTGADFSWARVDGLKIYAQTLNSSSTYDGSYIAFDGIRLDNENTDNPLYAMVAYSSLKNSYDAAQPIEKTENSQGYIEYRFGVNIV